MRNQVKIRKLILFGPKGLSLGIWTQNLGKRMSDLKSAPSEQGTRETLLRLKSYYFLTQNAKNWAFGLKTGKQMPDLRSVPSKEGNVRFC